MDTIEQKEKNIELRKLSRFRKKQVLSLSIRIDEHHLSQIQHHPIEGIIITGIASSAPPFPLTHYVVVWLPQVFIVGFISA